jgi:hypothetical protein
LVLFFEVNSIIMVFSSILALLGLIAIVLNKSMKSVSFNTVGVANE